MKAHLPSLEKANVYQWASRSLLPDLPLIPVLAPEVRSISQRCTTAIYRCTYGTHLLHFSMWSSLRRLFLGSWAYSWTLSGLEQTHSRMGSRSWARVRWRPSGFSDFSWSLLRQLVVLLLTFLQPLWYLDSLNPQRSPWRLFLSGIASNWYQLLRA